ncbi:MAG TPA: hypothetical protein VN778_00865 [Verrucomicrobiae bacterium]|nr:hypothetical protein [Verrucomicrobiae bacterium]
MAGTAKGGRLAAQKNKKKYGPDFYARIGRMGGQKGHTGGFAAGEAGRKRASYWGAVGGTRSRRH